MDNIKWIQRERQFYLESNGIVLIVLNIHSATEATFTLNETTYDIKKRGAWNPAFFVMLNDKEIVSLTHGFWGSRGKIVLQDGTMYESEYTSKGGLKLCFFNGENEILSYGLVFQNQRPAMQFTIGSEVMDAEWVLILAALGMTMFSAIYFETMGANTEAMASCLH